MAQEATRIIAGRYEIGGKIKQDPTSALYVARDIKSNRKVWIKIVNPDLASDKKFVDQFQKEAKILAELKSPQVPQMIDAGVEDDTCYMVLEASPGKTLAEILKEEGPLEVEQAMKVAEQVARCLHAMSQKGLVHRGINPGNILMTPAEEVVIIDFGLARSSGMAGMSFADVSAAPDYVSPEQVEGSQAVDVRSDIYALGATIYTILAGEVPYRGNNPMDVIMKHLSAPIPSLRAVCPDAPPAVDEVVKRCLAKAPRDRYQTPAELINAIRSAVALPPAELPVFIPAPPPLQVEKVAAPPTAPPPPPAKEQIPPAEKAAPPLPPAKEQVPPAEKATPLAALQIRCPHCGQSVSATQRLCARCGRSLASATPPSAVSVEPAPQKAARLVVRAGPDRGKTFVIDKDVRMGRGSGNDIALSDPRASRRHSQITRQGSQYILVDLGSSNGTFVNNKRTRIQGAHVLKEGDVIMLGESEIVFHC